LDICPEIWKSLNKPSMKPTLLFIFTPPIQPC
jgi:hypothetical protein